MCLRAIWREWPSPAIHRYLRLHEQLPKPATVAYNEPGHCRGIGGRTTPFIEAIGPLIVAARAGCITGADREGGARRTWWRDCTGPVSPVRDRVKRRKAGLCRTMICWIDARNRGKRRIPVPHAAGQVQWICKRNQQIGVRDDCYLVSASLSRQFEVRNSDIQESR